MTNNIFDFNRFGKVLSKDLRNLVNHFAGTVLFIASIDLLIFLVTSLSAPHAVIPHAVRLSIIIYGAYVAATIAPSILYGRINGKNKGIYYATLPASKFEKFVSMIIVCTLVAPIYSFVVSACVDTILTVLPFGCYSNYIWEKIPELDIPMAMSQVQLFLQELGVNSSATVVLINALLIGYLFTCVAFQICNTYLRKNKWLLSVVILIVLSGITEFIGMGQIGHGLKHYDYALLGKYIIGDIIAGWAIVSILTAWLWVRIKNMRY